MYAREVWVFVDAFLKPAKLKPTANTAYKLTALCIPETCKSLNLSIPSNEMNQLYFATISIYQFLYAISIYNIPPNSNFLDKAPQDSPPPPPPPPKTVKKI